MLTRKLFWCRSGFFALLGFGALLPAQGGLAADGGLKAVYEVYVGGFQVAKADLDVDLYRQCFDVRLAAEPGGLVSFLADFKLISWAGGCSNGVAVRPSNYSSDYFKDGRKKRWVRVDYGGRGLPTVQAEPEAGEDDRDQVPSDLRAGSLDPLTGAFSIIEAVTREGRCGGARPVYDGRRLFRLSLQHVGTVELRPSRYAAYAGPAIECVVSVEKVAGFKNNEIRKKHFPEQVRVFLAEAVEGAPLLPVRLEADYRFAKMRMHAARIVPDPASTKETRAR